MGPPAVYPGPDGGQVEGIKVGDHLRGHDIGNRGTEIDGTLFLLDGLEKCRDGIPG